VFSKKPEKARADKIRAYELAVSRCYPPALGPARATEKRLVLEIQFFRLRCFNELSRKRDRGDSFKLDGIVVGSISESVHVPVQLEVVGEAAMTSPGSAIGGYQLNHYGYTKPGGHGGAPEDRPMRLDMHLHDPEKLYQATLRDAMRDAAISGHRFLYAEVRYLATTKPEETKSPLDLMNERGYGPCYTFNDLALWPEINLPNAHPWATDTHKYWQE
jgi:hypothetical protein